MQIYFRYKFTFLPSGIAKDTTEQEHVASTRMSSLQTYFYQTSGSYSWITKGYLCPA